MTLPTPEELRALRDLPQVDLSPLIQEGMDCDTDCLEGLLREAITRHLGRKDWTLDEVRNGPLVCQVDLSNPLLHLEEYWYGGVWILTRFPPRCRRKDGALIFEWPYRMRGSGAGVVRGVT